MASIRFDESKLQDTQAGDSELTVRIMPQNTPYPRPSFVSDQSGGVGPFLNGDAADVDVYPEAIDEETARIVHEF